MEDSHARQANPVGPAAARWVRPALVAAAAAATALAGVAATIGFHNLRYSRARVLDILGGSADGDLALTAVDVPAWVEPFLQDLSVVSPALVLFTAARMLIAAVLLLQSPVSVRRWGSTHFPFPDPYKVYFIQMGLLGTIVGFVLAFAEVDPRAERQSLILLEALGTALWSTLTAIVLAYVFCPTVEIFFGRVRAALLPPEPRDSRSALELLRRRTSNAAEELAALSASTRSLTEENRALGAELRDRRLDSRVAQLEQRLADATTAVATVREALDALTARQGDLDATVRALQVRLDATDATLERHGGEIEANREAIAPMPEAIAGLATEAERGRAARSRLAALDAWIRRPPPRDEDSEGPA